MAARPTLPIIPMVALHSPCAGKTSIATKRLSWGSSAGDFIDKLLEGEFPWSRLRQAQKLLGLTDRYGAERLNATCRRALDFNRSQRSFLQKLRE